jgi:hypothetical protein
MVVSPEKKVKKSFSPRKTDKKFHKTNENSIEEDSIDKQGRTPGKQKKESAKETRKLRRKEEKEAILKQK